MTTELNISYDTSRPSRSHGAYSVSLAETADAAHPLRQIGPTMNGTVHYRGVFDDYVQAIGAALDYIASPCTLLERTDDASGEVTILVCPTGRQPAIPVGYSHRVIGSNTPHGRFVGTP